MGYTIKEIINCEVDDQGNISVSFILDSDEVDTLRVIESDDYYYFAEDKASEEYFGNEWYETDFLSESDFETGEFNFKEWLDFEHCDEKVMEFIEEYYPTIEDLPTSEKN